MAEEASDISLDSVASSTASDVLIRSTSIHRAWRDEAGSRAQTKSLGSQAAGTVGKACGIGSQTEGNRGSSIGSQAGGTVGMVGGTGSQAEGNRGSSMGNQAGGTVEKVGGAGSQAEGSMGSLAQGSRGYQARSTADKGGNQTAGMRGHTLLSGSHPGNNQKKLVHLQGTVGRGLTDELYHPRESASKANPQMGSPHARTEAGDSYLRVSERGIEEDRCPRSTIGEPLDHLLNSDKNRVHISVKRLREVTSPLHHFALKKHEVTYIPPALPANKYPAVQFISKDDKTDVVQMSGVQSMSTFSRKTSPPKVYVRKHIQDVTDVIRKNTAKGCNLEHKDIHISQYTTGQKEAFSAALNKKVHSAPVTKEVKVKLLEDSATGRKETSAPDIKQTQSVVDSATTIAAATAAAIAAAAPILQTQSSMEAQRISITQLLDKLHEADKQLQRLTEQQSRIPSQPLERSYHQDRVSELEKQLAQLTEQRLQHLEKLQQQQLEMQSRFISSAIKVGTCQHESKAAVCIHARDPALKHRPLSNIAVTAPSNHSEKVEVSHVEDAARRPGKSPLETPAPRRFAPVPISKDERALQIVSEKENLEELKNPAHLGKGKFLEQILGHEGSSFYRFSSSEAPQMNSHRRPHNDSPTEVTFSRSLSQSANPPAAAAVQKANDVLRDLGQLKQEMKGLLQEAKEWKPPGNEFKHWEPLGTSYLSSVLHKPQHSLLGNVKPQKSMFEDTERILKEVQNNKKVLEDNLESIIRGKDGASMYTLISALTTNSDAAEKIRIRKYVDSWITEISSEIQDEMTRKDYDHKVQELGLAKKAKSTKDIKDKNEKNSKALVKPASLSTKMSSGVSAKTQPKHNDVTAPGPHSRKDVAPAVFRKDERSKMLQRSVDTSMQDEDVLDKVYGKPIYQGNRSTLKKGPYLRFSSPSPKSKPHRPRILETVRGIKQKSAKTQTSATGCKVTLTKLKSQERCLPMMQEPQYLFSPTGQSVSMSAPMEGHLIPMAIPLGRSRFDEVCPLPSSVTLTRPHSVTITTSIPSSPSKPQARTVKPNVAVLEVLSEKKDPPQLSVQVLPSVDIDSIVSESTEISEQDQSLVVPAPSLTLPPAGPDIQLPETVETEEEVLAFPGSSFVRVTEVTQDEESEADIPEPLLELNGRAENAPPQYTGIPFPPPAPQTTSDVLDSIISRRETLENRLVSWVEQEIMARIISEMYPVRQEAVPDMSHSSSDASASVTSDIVETAGGEGLQLFVDAGVPVDSNLIRKFVDEALAETIAVMLGEREARKPRSPPASNPEILAEAPQVPTPQCTPPASPLPLIHETSLVKTPELSRQTSVAEAESVQEQPEDTGPEISARLVVTPVRTPVASPPRVATPTLVILDEPEDERDLQSPGPPSPWGNTELPLEEENPHSVKEVPVYKDAVVMTVEKDEDPASLLSLDSIEPDKPSVPLEPNAPSPAPSLSSAPSTEESSLTITSSDSDTTDRPISEGEVLYSYGQLIAARAVAEGGFSYPNLTQSLSSTLRDAQEMEYDPPSEGQVIYRPRRGAHRDPVLSLLATFNQNPIAPYEPLYHPEISEEDNSVGELSEGQRPRLTTAAEKVLVGHSGFLGQATGHRGRALSSPGQCTTIPETNHDEDDISPGPMSIGELDSQPEASHSPHFKGSAHASAPAYSASQGPEISNKEHQPSPTRFILVGMTPQEDPQKGPLEDLDRTVVEPSIYLNSLSDKALGYSKKMSVALPSADDHENDNKRTFAESDSSGADTF